MCCSDRGGLRKLHGRDDVFVVGEQTHQVRPGYVDREPLDEGRKAPGANAELAALELETQTEVTEFISSVRVSEVFK